MSGSSKVNFDTSKVNFARGMPTHGQDGNKARAAGVHTKGFNIYLDVPEWGTNGLSTGKRKKP